MTTMRRVDIAHNPRITPNAIPTLCPTLPAVEVSVLNERFPDEVKELVVWGVVTKEIGNVDERVVLLLLLRGAAISDA
jgi:hypothetical protein